MILMWSCPGNVPKYYPGLRDILPRFRCPRFLNIKYPTIEQVKQSSVQNVEHSLFSDSDK